jgi:hypothetical protein
MFLRTADFWTGAAAFTMVLTFIAVVARYLWMHLIREKVVKILIETTEAGVQRQINGSLVEVRRELAAVKMTVAQLAEQPPR